MTLSSCNHPAWVHSCKDGTVKKLSKNCLGTKPLLASKVGFKLKLVEVPLSEIIQNQLKDESRYLSEVFKNSDVIESIIDISSDNSFDRLVDVCLQTMVTAETAIFILEVNDSNQNGTDKSFQKFEINLTLLSLQEDALELFEIPSHTLVSLASTLKADGVSLFSLSRLWDAASKFTRALKYLNVIDPKSDVNFDVQEKLDLEATLKNNLAACYLKFNDFDAVISLTTQALKIQPENSKSFYRRGTALFQLQEYDKAFEDFTKVKALDPTSALTVDKKLLELRKRKAKSDATIKSAMQKMFQ